MRLDEARKHFPISKGIFKRTVGHVRAVDGVSLELRTAETVGLVGESGSGKTTAGRMVCGLYRPTSGAVYFDDGRSEHDVSKLSGENLRRFRRAVQVVFQDPYSSLNPWMRVSQIIGEPLVVQGANRKSDIDATVRSLLVDVGLRPEHANRFPHQFSGGQRQRIGIARALALRPRLVVADEPVSSLDVSVQAQILNLMIDLQRRHGLSYLLIAHDLGVVRYASDRIAVMYFGRLVEIGPAEQVFRAPRHPYTEALLSASPVPDPRLHDERIVLRGDVPSAAHPPPGCPFHPRCIYAIAECRVMLPQLGEHTDGHRAACIRAGELSLRGKSVSRLPWDDDGA